MGCAASTATAMPAAVPAPATVPSKQPTQGDVGGCNPKATKHEKEPVTSRGAVEEKHAEGRGSEQSEDKPGEVLLKASASELKEDALPEIESLSGEHRVAFCADAQEPATGHETKDAKPVEEEKQTEKNSQGDEVPYTSPVRLLLVDSFAKFTISVPCYENLPPDSYVDVPFENYEEECAKDAAVISWRWMRMKPPSQEAALDPEACPVPVPLVEYVTGKAREDGIKYLWLDWSCAPQYPEDLAATMREINRSGKYYATARGFYIWCFADRVTDESFQHSDYFYRAWTLSERLHRANTKGVLITKDFVPSSLRDLFSRGCPLDPTSSWGPLMAEITMMATIPLMVHGNLDPDSCTNIGRVVVKRYPQLDEVAKLVDGPFRTLLHPDVHAALQASLTLLAVGEWIAQPDEDLDDMIRASGCSVLGFKRGLLHSLVNQARMTLNNSSSGFTSQLESMATGAENLSDRDSVSSFLEPLKGVWAMALDSPTAESAVSCEWLRRYLMVEIGRSYKAFSSVDLLFAIYKLFLAEDFSYGQEESLYQALVDKAGFRFFSPSGEDPYAWLKELAHLEKDEAAVVSSSTGTCQNDRSVTAFATSPSNFGIFSLGSKTPSGGPAAIPEIFGGEEYDNTLTHVLGFHLDSEAQSGFCLPGCSLSRVDKEQGGEIDSHLSLRGRRALSKFEDRLHAAIKEQLAQPWEDNCGLFVVVRYGTMSCLTRCLVVRTSCAGAGSSGGWTAEYVTAFGSEPQKGSSWGIAKSLECLVDDLCVLPGVVGASYMSFGTVEAIAENFPLSNGFLSDPHDEEWFSGFPLALTAGAEPTRAPIPEGGVESSGKGLGDLPGDSGDSKLSHDHSGFSVGRVEVPLPAVPAGKTTFGGHEIDLVGEIHACMAKSGFDSESLMAYYKVLERNYVHDSVMAGHLGYFAQLCDVFATQLSDGAAQQAVLNQPMLKQRFDYFVEDFGDAISDSDDCEEAKTLARGALDRLQAILDGAQ